MLRLSRNHLKRKLKRANPASSERYAIFGNIVGEHEQKHPSSCEKHSLRPKALVYTRSRESAIIVCVIFVFLLITSIRSYTRLRVHAGFSGIGEAAHRQEDRYRSSQSTSCSTSVVTIRAVFCDTPTLSSSSSVLFLS